MNKYPIKKYHVPNELVSEPKGTLWSVETEENKNAIYIQVSDDLKLPHWTRFGNLLESVFEPFCNDATFMEEIFRLYTKEQDTIDKIKTIIKK